MAGGRAKGSVGPRFRPIAPASARGPAAPRTAAFTLIELLTVMAIVGVLAGIVMGVGRRASETGKVARAKAELAALAAALETYRQHYGSYPQIAADSSTSSLSGRTLFAALNGWRGPALASSAFAARRRVFVQSASLTLADAVTPDAVDNAFVDPWGNPYHYAFNAATNGWLNPGFVLYSVGPDGAATDFPPDGRKTTDYDAALKDDRPVNVDNLYANQ